MTPGSEKLLQLNDIELAFSRGSSKERRKYLTLIEETQTARRGGLGETVRVRTMSGESLACKKLLLPERSAFGSAEAYEAEAAHRERAFREEYDTLCRLSNFKGFVKARAYGRVGDVPIILMEWVEGVSAGNAVQFLKDGPDAPGANPLAVAQVGRDVFHLLARLEAETELFVHRDLSASNIMIRTSGRPIQTQVADGRFDVCFIDFGSAATLRAGDGAFTTDTRILRGATPGYAPPEMLSNDLPGLDELRRSTKIDVYAACSVLYEMLCGHLPFDVAGRTGAGSDYLFKMMNDPAPSGFAEGTVARLLADILCRGICATQDARASSYAMYKMLEFYADHYDENVGRSANGKDLIALNPRSIDRPDFRFDQISLSNPLAGEVMRVGAASAADGSVETAAMTPDDARAISASNAARAAARASYGKTAAARGAQANQAGRAAQRGVPAASVPAQRQSRAGQVQQRVSPNAGVWQQAGAPPARDVRARSGSGNRRSVLPKVAIVAAVLAVVTAVVVAAVIILGSGGGSATGKASSTTGTAAAGTSAASAEGAGASGQTAASGSDDSGLLGTWSGKMVSTSSGPACFGAESYPLKLTFTSVSDSGAVVCDVEVLYHGHNRSTQTGDATAVAGDDPKSFTGVHGVVENGKLVLTIDLSGEMGRDSGITITCAESSDSATISATVTSAFSGATTVDEYSLNKQ